MSGGDIGDLEDVVSPVSGDTLLRLPRRDVVPGRRSRASMRLQEACSTVEGSVPGSHTVHVRTWGCSHNNSDGEYMTGQLASYGYRITEQPADADLWVLNSCTVKNPSESHFVTAVRQARQQGKKVVVAGCVPQADRKHNELDGLSTIGVQQIDRVVEVVEETLKGNTMQLFGMQRAEGGKKSGGARLSLPKVRKNRLVEIVPINTGCLNQCTYCKTVHARGKLGSYPVAEILERVKEVLDEGVRELWFTSEDLGTYGRDIGTSLPELLWQVVGCLPEGTMLRLGMTNPPYILEHKEEISRILNHPRVYSFIHIPVQSGSDRVLSDMRRQYTVADFRALVDHLRARVPGITIATDVICGFPTETDEDFRGTMELVRQYKFPILYISQFYPRPGTPAAAMKQAKTQIKKQRSREVSAFFKSYELYGDRVGTRCWVLVTDRAADGLHLVGHNKAYEQILLPELEGLMGSFVEVIVTAVGKYHQLAELVDDAWWQKQPALPALPVANRSTAILGSSATGGLAQPATNVEEACCGGGGSSACACSSSPQQPGAKDVTRSASLTATSDSPSSISSGNVPGLNASQACAAVGGILAMLVAVQAAENAGML